MGSNPTADRVRPWGHFSQGWQRGCIIETESSGCHDSLAERSKAVAQGAIPKGRGFEPHSCHSLKPSTMCVCFSGQKTSRYTNVMG